MLQHVIQRYLDNESMVKRRQGLCWFIVSSTDTIISDVEVQSLATAIWCSSTAVPSSRSYVYPVAHPAMSEEEAYWDAQANETMLTGVYGENRKQYAEFVRDYAEEYWR